MIFSPERKLFSGVTGGIAAYKSCFLVGELVKRNAEVRVVMTPSAVEFISLPTLSTLSNHKVLVNAYLLLSKLQSANEIVSEIIDE